MCLLYGESILKADFYYGLWSNFLFIENEAVACKL